MNKLTFTLLTILTLSFSAQSSDMTKLEICTIVSEQASEIMTYRQSNGSMPELLTTNTNEAFIEVVVMAYNIPLYRVEKNKRSAIGEFKNDIFLWCLDQVND